MARKLCGQVREGAASTKAPRRVCVQLGGQLEAEQLGRRGGQGWRRAGQSLLGGGGQAP